MERITKEQIQAWLPKREPDAHKGDFGRILVIAGSRGMMGACILACRAAFRSGSGLVAACCPPEFFSVVHTIINEINERIIIFLFCWLLYFYSFDASE